ncbi:MAG: hypothetical protein DMG33_14175 [Acidobacteria bacterium]|nr:MAG: hypothetical protein DMG33_14175 [Acidobacteriota bacterium]
MQVRKFHSALVWTIWEVISWDIPSNRLRRALPGRPPGTVPAILPSKNR